MKPNIAKVLAVTAGVVVAGLAMKYGKDLPVLKQAKQGFTSAG